ncbi:MAG: hypothetical protein HRU20_30280, partial [Pseudomonadales bacterium]|nr:hypothetical protein [Pseudomonadales bacterium]
MGGRFSTGIDGTAVATIIKMGPVSATEEYTLRVQVTDSYALYDVSSGCTVTYDESSKKVIIHIERPDTVTVPITTKFRINNHLTETINILPGVYKWSLNNPIPVCVTSQTQESTDGIYSTGSNGQAEPATLRIGPDNVPEENYPYQVKIEIVNNEATYDCIGCTVKYDDDKVIIDIGKESDAQAIVPRTAKFRISNHLTDTIHFSQELYQWSGIHSDAPYPNGPTTSCQACSTTKEVSIGDDGLATPATLKIGPGNVIEEDYPYQINIQVLDEMAIYDCIGCTIEYKDNLVYIYCPQKNVASGNTLMLPTIELNALIEHNFIEEDWSEAEDQKCVEPQGLDIIHITPERFRATLGDYQSIRVDLMAPAGEIFTIRPIDGASSTTLGLCFDYRSDTTASNIIPLPSLVDFIDLTGIQPNEDGDVSYYQEGGRFIKINKLLTISGPI